MRLKLYLYAALTILCLLWTAYFIISIRDTRAAQIQEGGVGTEIGASMATQIFVLPGLLGIALFGILTRRAYQAVKRRTITGDPPPAQPLDPHLE